MSTFYVSASGNDANPGTQAQPWRTPQHGVDSNILHGGDVCIIQGVIDFQGIGPGPNGDFMDLVNRKQPGASAAAPVTIQGAAGNLITCTSGITGFGSCKYWVFDGLNIRAAGGATPYGVGIYIAGDRSDAGLAYQGVTPDGAGADYITVKNCTIDVINSGFIARDGIGLWGCDHLSVTGNTIKHTSDDTANGGGSAISIGAPKSTSSEAGIHVRISRNLISMIGPGTLDNATDRNGINLDLYHTGSPPLVGDTMIDNNIVMNVTGRGIELNRAGRPNSRVCVVNNTVIGPFIRDSRSALGPAGGIGCYGQGVYNNATLFNNLVMNGALGNGDNYNIDAYDNSATALQGAANWSFNGTVSISPPGSSNIGIIGTADPLLVNPLTTGAGNYRPGGGAVATAIFGSTYSSPTLTGNPDVHNYPVQVVPYYGWGSDLAPSTPNFRTRYNETTAATYRVMTACSARASQKPSGHGFDQTGLEDRVALASHQAYADEIAAEVVNDPGITHLQVWNELKGYYGAGGVGNRWGYEEYTDLYNRVYDAVKAVRPDIKIGGPYVVLNKDVAGSGSSTNPTSDPTLNGPWGICDQRDFDVLTYWFANAHGYDFVCVDAPLATRPWPLFDPPNPNTAYQFYAAAARWIRQYTNKPIWWSEIYPYTSTGIWWTQVQASLQSVPGEHVLLWWAESNNPAPPVQAFPTSSSPIVGRGLTTFNGWTAPNIDFYGQQRVAPYSIGAAEPSGAVLQPPVANFTFAPGTANTGVNVTFTDSSTNTPTSWLWDFGDGSTSTTQSPTHSWSTAGTKTVTMTATNGAGNNSVSKTIVITQVAGQVPIANFTLNPSIGTAGSSITFTDTSTGGAPTSWAWNFGDGSTSTVQNPSHTFTTAGTYQVQLIATNANGASQPVIKSVLVNPVSSGGAVDHLTLFKQTYPCSLAQTLYVDGNTGNDGNPGTNSAPLRSIPAAISRAAQGTEIIVRAATYASGNVLSCQGAANNHVRIIGDPGAKIGRIDGSGSQPQSTGFFAGGGRFIAIFGFELQGSQDIETGTGGVGDHSNGRYDTGVRLTNGNNIHIWKCHIHHCGSHGIAQDGNNGVFGCSDMFYNTIHDNANWDPYAGSGISIYGPSNVGTPAADGYHYRIKHNMIWRADELIGDQTDGNAIILDSWQANGFTGKGIVDNNLTIGCGGRGCHELNSNNGEFYFNTAGDNVLRLTGSWDADLSLFAGVNCKMKYNIGFSQTGRNRVGFQGDGQGNPVPSNDWSQNLFLRGTGGSSANDPTPGNSNSVNKTGVGPATYFVNYTSQNVVAPSDYRPKDAQVTRVTPDPAVRSLLAPWPDFYGFLRPAGDWAYGCFENPANTTGGGTPAPVANFTVTPASPTQGVSATFTDTSSNTPTSWAWDFGDAGTSTSQNPTHTFATSGTFTVKLTATNAGGSSVSQKTVTVVGSGGGGVPVANFTTSANPTQGVAVAFTDSSTNTPTSWSWNFGDGSAVVTTQNASHTFASSGTFNVSHTATNANGTNTVTKQVVIAPVSGGGGTTTVYQAEDATLFGSNYPADQFSMHVDTGGPGYNGTGYVGFFGQVGQGVRFSVTVANGGQATLRFRYRSVAPQQRTIAVNGVTIAANVVLNPTAQFWTDNSWIEYVVSANLNAGVNTVEFRIDAGVDQYIDLDQLAVDSSGPQGQAPVAAFTKSAVTITAGGSITFTDTTTGAPTAWLWDFGDGLTSTAQSPSHTFANAGSYPVKLIATNAFGSTQASQTVAVNAVSTSFPPVSIFTFLPSNPSIGDLVTFTDASTNTPTSWAWSFGDGLTSTAQNPTHVYSGAGTFTVSLLATNAVGSNSSSHTVTVANPTGGGGTPGSGGGSTDPISGPVDRPFLVGVLLFVMAFVMALLLWVLR